MSQFEIDSQIFERESRSDSGFHSPREINWEPIYYNKYENWDDISRTSVEDPTSAPRLEYTRRRDRRLRSDYERVSDSDSEGYDSVTEEEEQPERIQERIKLDK